VKCGYTGQEASTLSSRLTRLAKSNLKHRYRRLKRTKKALNQAIKRTKKTRPKSAALNLGSKPYQKSQRRSPRPTINSRLRRCCKEREGWGGELGEPHGAIGQGGDEAVAEQPSKGRDDRDRLGPIASAARRSRRPAPAAPRNHRGSGPNRRAMKARI